MFFATNAHEYTLIIRALFVCIRGKIKNGWIASPFPLALEMTGKKNDFSVQMSMNDLFA